MEKNMLREAAQVNVFGRKEEEKQNPYIGFTSFQHFRDEALYSDVVVRPENKMTETENLECYPVPEYVPQNGREEGFYPDTTIAYIRILWKEFEPRQGEYNYALIEGILSKARACGQTVMFRLFGHSTRASDDVPDWLKEIIPCPERPEGMRVKDSPKDPRYFEYFAKAIRAIAERFDTDPTLYMVDICMPGAWGEGHKLELYADNILEVIVDVYTSVFKKTRLFGQVGRPELLKYANQKIMTGWRGDGFGDPFHIDESYPPKIEKVKDMWKTVPVSFESYWWLGEWKRKGWDVDMLIDRSLEWHLSSFNAKSLPVPFEWQEKVEAWLRKMGYHYLIDSVSYPEKIRSCEKAKFTVCIDNIGVAPMYMPIPLHLKLKGDGVEYTFRSDTDLTKWLPGKHKGDIVAEIPSDVVPGEYDVEIGLLRDDGMIAYFCTDAEYDDGFYKVGKLVIE